MYTATDEDGGAKEVLAFIILGGTLREGASFQTQSKEFTRQYIMAAKNVKSGTQMFRCIYV